MHHAFKALFILGGLLAASTAIGQETFSIQRTAGSVFPLEVTPLDARGEGVPVWSHSGSEFLVFHNGEFGLRFHNKSRKALRVVVGVDDVNTITGERWEIHGTGYIIPPNSIVVVTRDQAGRPLHFSHALTDQGSGSIRWAVFNERMWWADTRRSLPLPTLNEVPASHASHPQWEASFYSATPYHDFTGEFRYDKSADLVLMGVIPKGVGNGWWVRDPVSVAK